MIGGTTNTGVWTDGINIGVWQGEDFYFDRRLCGSVTVEPKYAGTVSNEPKYGGTITNEPKFGGEVTLVGCS